MTQMIFALIALILALVALPMIITFRRKLKKLVAYNADKPRYDRDGDEDEYQTKKFIAIAAFVALFTVFGILMITDCFTIVPARNVGVVNVFGNANESLPNGFHLVPPWASVEKVDTTYKSIQLTDDGSLANGCSSIAIRISTQTTACQDVFVQWEIDPHGDANELWKNYRGNNDDLINNIQNNVILPRLRSDMQAVFSTYNPLAVLQGGQLEPTTALEPEVRSMLTGDMPSGVLLLDLRFAQIHYDDATQGQINTYSLTVAGTKIAEQQGKTALLQAQINKELAADPGTNNPGVMFQNCLNLLQTLASKNQLGSLPVGSLQCVAGQGSNVPFIVNNGKA